MNKKDLLNLLKRNKVPSISYSLNGIKDGECLCLYKKNNVWHVVYNSRGKIINIAQFKLEEEAYAFIYEEMKKQYKW
jgi:hypothetical protein